MRTSTLVGICVSAWLGLAAFGCSSDGGSTAGTSNAPRGPIGKADAVGSCANTTCDGKSEGNCWCDSDCEDFGDCCEDRGVVCGEDCEGKLSWLQKDAHREEPGRNFAFWPPHTTMLYTVTCGGEKVDEAVMPNHGTMPDKTSADGKLMLTEVKAETFKGDRDELVKLARSMESCECGTEFMSTDVVDQDNPENLEKLLTALATYLQTNLQCADETKHQAVLKALEDRNISEFLSGAEECSWKEGASWEAGLNASLSAVLGDGKSLESYHVCNNDASLQADLWEQFKASGSAGTCDASSAICAGPKWYYTP